MFDLSMSVLIVCIFDCHLYMSVLRWRIKTWNCCVELFDSIVSLSWNVASLMMDLTFTNRTATPCRVED
jgi:hypothetical protein